MNQKHDVSVKIDGKKYTLCGYESEDYLQEIASHINNCIDEIKKQSGYGRLDALKKRTLLNINLTNDFLKAKKQAEEFQKQNVTLDQELLQIKHDLITSQETVNALKTEVDRLKVSLTAAQQNILRQQQEIQKKETDFEKVSVAQKAAEQEKQAAFHQIKDLSDSLVSEQQTRAQLELLLQEKDDKLVQWEAMSKKIEEVPETEQESTIDEMKVTAGNSQSHRKRKR